MTGACSRVGVTALKVGIIGCGFIGSTLANAVDDLDEVSEVALLDSTPGKAERIAASLKKGKAVADGGGLIAGADLVVEAAGHEAVREYGPRAVEAGKDILVMSVGALVDDVLWNGLKATAHEKGCRVFLPTGGLGGIDLLKAASQAQLQDVRLVTRKPPKAFATVRYVTKKGIDLMSLNEPLVVFEGTAREAVRHFPKNVNVAATVSLAGIGFDRTKVTIIADPQMTRNYHELILEGRFGKMRCSVLNAPSTTNPQTSYIAALSPISTLKNIVKGVWIGV
jgi:aspartate dehydrogenase